MFTQRDGATGSTEVIELTPQDMTDLLDREARRLLNISGEEFRQKWAAGGYADDSDPHVTQVAMLLPNGW